MRLWRYYAGIPAPPAKGGSVNHEQFMLALDLAVILVTIGALVSLSKSSKS